MFGASIYAAVGFWSVALAGGLYWGGRHVRALEARARSDCGQRDLTVHHLQES